MRRGPSLKGCSCSALVCPVWDRQRILVCSGLARRMVQQPVAEANSLHHGLLCVFDVCVCGWGGGNVVVVHNPRFMLILSACDAHPLPATGHARLMHACGIHSCIHASLCSLTLMQALGLGMLSLTLWNTTLAYVSPAVSSPFSRALAFPHGSSLAAMGGVAIFPWLLMCDKASTALAKAWFPDLPSAVVPSTVQAQAQGPVVEAD